METFRGILYFLVFLSPLTTALPYHTTASSISNCIVQANVPQYFPTTSNFTQAIVPFNLRLPFTPTAVAIPSDDAQVAAAVSCAASLNVTVSARSGGHSYASHGLGGENGHLMLDLRNMRSVIVDEETGIAEVGPGARLGNVATALYEQNRGAISHGTCPR